MVQMKSDLKLAVEDISILKKKKTGQPKAKPSVALKLGTRTEEEAQKPRSQPRYLTPLKGKVKRKRVVTFDIESKDGSTQRKGFTRPFLLGFYDGEIFHHFTNDVKPKPAEAWNERHLDEGGCIDKFCSWLFRTEPLEDYQSKNALIYAHNGGRFDVLFILAWLLRHDDEFGFKITPTMSKIQMLVVWRLEQGTEGGTWTFLDSVGILPGSLKDLAKAYGVKGKVGMELDSDESDILWIEYNRQDCVALYDVLMKFHEVVEDLGGEVKISAPATAMATYRRKFQSQFLKRNAHFPHCKGEADGTCSGCAHKWIRLAYYGGRTEMFSEYGSNLRYFDINSSYPFSMQFPMPVGRMFHLANGTEHKKWMRRFVDTHVGFIEATVEIPSTCKYPPLPYRMNGKLIFPTGKFSGVWDAEEIKLLFHPRVGGKIVEVHQSLWFEGKPILNDFIQNIYALRKSEKDLKKKYAGRELTEEEDDQLKSASAIAAVAKLLLNSLYGKFGMSPERTAYVHVKPGDLPPLRATPLGCFDGDDIFSALWLVPQEVTASYIIPQIAAHITALSRKRLFEIMMDVADRGGTVYYVDTDSVICDVDLPESTELGGLKNEYPGARMDAHFLRPKLYQIDLVKKDKDGKEKHVRKQAMKGLPQAHKEDHAKELEWFADNEVFIDAPKGRTEKEKVAFARKFGGFEKRRAKDNEDLFTAMRDGYRVSLERLEQFRGMIRRGVKDHVLPSPMMRKVEKSVRSQYDKRRQIGGGETVPWVLDEEREVV